MLHVLPLDLARGAQVYARDLRDALDDPDQCHRTATLFAAPPAALRPDHSLRVRPGRLRGAGLHPGAAWALWRLLRRLRPDVVVAHGGEPLLYLAALPRRARLVYLRIGVGGAAVGDRWRGRVWRWAARRADVVVCVSDDSRQDAIEVLGLAPAALRVIPNGRDPARFARPDQRPVGGPLRLVWIGHLDEGKRPWFFLDVVHRLEHSGVDIAAAMVGEGPLADRIRPRAEMLGVELLGRRDDVPELLAQADVLCFTSGAYEGMPGVLIEAGLAGLPVVTTAAPGVRSVVQDGETGFVVDLDDVESFTDRVGRLAAEAGLGRRMGDAARDRCRAHFTFAASVERWRALFAELVAPGPPFWQQ